MSRNWLVVLVVGGSLAAAAELSEKFSKRLDSAESTYQQAVAKADNVRFYAVQKANSDRVKALKQVLTDATKAGDFDAATAIKERVSEAEKIGPKEKPKDTIKFGGHEYALIDVGKCWYAAKQACEAMGGHLIVIESADELALLDRLCNAKHIVWLGASDHDKNDSYLWLTGKPVDTSTAMLDRESNGIADVLCYDAGIHKIIDWYSGGQLFYVCEWDN